MAEYGARERKRYGIRVEIVAKALVCLASGENRAPGHARILELCALLRATAGENPDPAVLSRTQFVAAFRGTVKGFSKRDAGVFFSSLDSKGVDRARVGSVAAALVAAHRSGASSLTLDGRDRSASKTARHVCPLVRTVAAAYDPEHDGLLRDEVAELLSSCAVKREDTARVEELLARTPEISGRANVPAEDLCGALKDPRNGALLAEFYRQLGAYQAAVGDQFMAGLGLKNAAATKRHGRRGAVSASLDGGLAEARDLAPLGLAEMVEESQSTQWRTS